MKLRSKAFMAILPLSIALLATGCTDTLAKAEGNVKTASSNSPASGSLDTGSSAPTDLGVSKEDVLKRLTQLQVSNPGSMSGYSRDRFPHWLDATSNLGWSSEVAACDVKWAVRWEQGINLTWDDQSQCQMTINEGGGWQDRYGVLKDSKDPNSGLKPYKVSDDPSKFDIDHIVSLGDAWRTGAASWESDDVRSRLANDPLNLEISDPSANRGKGDLSASGYLPPGEFRCEYAQRYTLVKSKYSLSVTDADKERLTDTINQCM